MAAFWAFPVTGAALGGVILSTRFCMDGALAPKFRPVFDFTKSIDNNAVRMSETGCNQGIDSPAPLTRIRRINVAAGMGGGWLTFLTSTEIFPFGRHKSMLIACVSCILMTTGCIRAELLPIRLVSTGGLPIRGRLRRIFSSGPLSSSPRLGVVC